MQGATPPISDRVAPALAQYQGASRWPKDGLQMHATLQALAAPRSLRWNACRPLQAADPARCISCQGGAAWCICCSNFIDGHESPRIHFGCVILIWCIAFFAFSSLLVITVALISCYLCPYKATCQVCLAMNTLTDYYMIALLCMWLVALCSFCCGSVGLLLWDGGHAIACLCTDVSLSCPSINTRDKHMYRRHEWQGCNRELKQHVQLLHLLYLSDKLSQGSINEGEAMVFSMTVLLDNRSQKHFEDAVLEPEMPVLGGHTDQDVRKCNEMASAVGEVMVLEVKGDGSVTQRIERLQNPKVLDKLSWE
jgi:hypothetical protein